MCNLYTLEPNLIALAEDFEKFLGRTLHLEAGADTLANQPRKPYVAPKGLGLFVRPIDPANPSGVLEPAAGRWGIVPAHHKGPAKAWPKSTNNCRSETMWTLPAFKDSLATRRCIIPATNFSEWTGPEGKKTKHKITAANGSLLFMAGLWATHTWDGETTESYTMVMRESVEGDDMHRFHNRQPVFLGRETVTTWLDLDVDYRTMLASPPRGSLAFDPPQPAARSAAI